jgi:predicted ABC-type sugar transport system permease subunit
MPGGAVVSYRGSWCAEGLRTSWEAAWRIVGERGTLTWGGIGTVAGGALGALIVSFIQTGVVAAGLSGFYVQFCTFHL